MKRMAALLLIMLMSAAVHAQIKKNAELYGALRYSFNYIDEKEMWQIKGLQGRGNLSWLGIKGEWGRESLAVFFNLQVEAYSDASAGGPFKQRYYYGGLKGRFGRIAFGRMTNAYKKITVQNDVFWHFSKIKNSGQYATYGPSYGQAPAASGYTDNTLQYSSPVFEGLQLTGSISIDDSNADDHGFVAAGSFSRGSISAGLVAAFNGETAAALPGIDPGGEAIRGYIALEKKSVRLKLSFENADSGGENINYAFAAVVLPMAKIKTDFQAAVGWVGSGPLEGFGGSIGMFHTILENARIFALLSLVDLESGQSPFVISLGADYNFSFDITGNQD